MDGRKSEGVTRLILYLKYIIIQLQVRQKLITPIEVDADTKEHPMLGIYGGKGAHKEKLTKNTSVICIAT